MSLTCYTCEKVFVYQYEYILHRGCRNENKMNQTETTYTEVYVYEYDGLDCNFKRLGCQCNGCQKEYIHESRCKAHIKTHDTNVTNECNLCDKRFTTGRYLKEHIQVHCFETPYQCNVCNKPFIRKDKLVQHTKNVHAKAEKENIEFPNPLKTEKRFKCKLCSKQYTRQQHLDSHLRSHSGDLPHECQYCSKKFLRADHLKNHEVIHKYDSKRNKCECGVCEKLFSKELLQLHMTEQHCNTTPFKCDVCDREFDRKGNLIYHKRSHTRSMGGTDKEKIEKFEMRAGKHIYCYHVIFFYYKIIFFVFLLFDRQYQFSVLKLFSFCFLPVLTMPPQLSVCSNVCSAYIYELLQTV